MSAIITRSLDNGTLSAYTVRSITKRRSHNLIGDTTRFDYAFNNMSDITAVQRDSGSGDGYIYDLTEQITAYEQNGTVNLGAGYDAKNRQIARSINGLVTFSAFDAWEVVEEFSLGNVPAGACYYCDDWEKPRTSRGDFSERGVQRFDDM